MPPRLAVSRGERRQVDVRQRIAGDHQERLVAEELRARAHPAGCAEQLLLEAVGDALAEVLANRLREVVQVGDHAVEGVPVDQVEMCSITGLSSTGTIGLVISYVSGRSRVPSPAARTIAFIRMR